MPSSTRFSVRARPIYYAKDRVNKADLPDYESLADPKWSDDELIDFMLAHPILINRPIVVTPNGVRLCRPSELVLELLDRPVDGFVKEDGEAVSTKS